MNESASLGIVHQEISRLPEVVRGQTKDAELFSFEQKAQVSDAMTAEGDLVNLERTQY